MVVDQDMYQVPIYRVPITEEDLVFIDGNAFEGEPENFNLSAGRAAEVFNSKRMNIENKKAREKVELADPKKHWFRITKECTRDTNAGFAAKLEVLKR